MALASRFHNVNLKQRVLASSKQRPTMCRRSAMMPVCAQAGSVNVLLVGSGGREHALAWRMSQSDSTKQVYVAPGNPGTEAEDKVTNVALNTSKHSDVVQFCKEKGVHLVVVGPEAPLVAGLADDLAMADIPCWGPSAKAAQLEGSKAFMKDILKKYNIPTAVYEKFVNPDMAKDFIKGLGAPIVVKTSGLAAGKGVIVAQTLEQALGAVDDLMVKKIYGDAGDQIIVEEFLDGEEASFFALVNGEESIAMAAAQDHKAIFEGDTGPNTGGMGSYSPASIVTPEISKQVMDEIVYRTARGMAAEGHPFKGTLFAGLMIKDGRAKLLEHNVRFGDPECQTLMARTQGDFTEALLQAATGRMQNVQLAYKQDAGLTVVVAANGYPGNYPKGSVIKGTDTVSGAKVFHAGTALNANGELISAGGRVLNVTALGNDVAEAQANAYKGCSQIQWADAYYRKDIGWKDVARLKGARV
eukprot:CAMPEP_0202353260 /NCGR_PEP_ID=MMETSP1126-20121109/9099_1 /ASSEMBLY_ACC=CAM_ASM_000457 /TAXON_ID=3047 /ORGANISM="Dunaliella tertiolecta, Strain CCMP1320" /LENGTH=470 /DNA_ID=CAMNT_0048945587 /DNA_START=40 /DNA_END=1452 /DNA_ORIENTATION=+